MVPIAKIGIGVITLVLGYLVFEYLTKEDEKEQNKTDFDPLEFILCPGGQCEIKKENLKDCGFCHTCSIDLTQLKIKKSLPYIEEPESRDFLVPSICDGNISWREYSLTQQELDSFKHFGCIESFAKTYKYYDGLLLEENGLHKLFVDQFWLMGYSIEESEKMVYEYGLSPNGYYISEVIGDFV